MGTPALRLVRSQPCRPDDHRLQRVGGASGHTYTLTRHPNETTDIDVVVVREGKTFKGRMLGIVLGIFGKRVLGKALATTVKAIESRNYGARTAEQT